ncbi:hypothetical protein M3Y97_01079800 [Aphelenchoides bicaudatus]|nr:hypothetical protein M3Y97_01079800 [Aphelenchoides bicaudatus]
MSTRQFIFVGFLLVMAVMVVIEARDQSIWARGKVTCKGQPAGGLVVGLYDHDMADPDDKVGQTISEGDGSFNVSGFTESKSDINPYINYIHNCTDNQDKTCSKVSIPANYINDGNIPTKVYEASVVELHDLSSVGCPLSIAKKQQS